MSSELHFERMIRHAEKLGLECPPDLSDRVFSKLEGVSPPEERNECSDQDPFLLIVKVTSGGDHLAGFDKQDMARDTIVRNITWCSCLGRWH